MKKITLFTILALFVFSGTALAADLEGTWVADNWCVPLNNFDPSDPTAETKHEVSTTVITQNGRYFVAVGVDPNQMRCAAA